MKREPPQALRQELNLQASVRVLRTISGGSLNNVHSIFGVEERLSRLSCGVARILTSRSDKYSSIDTLYPRAKST